MDVFRRGPRDILSLKSFQKGKKRKHKFTKWRVLCFLIKNFAMEWDFQIPL